MQYRTLGKTGVRVSTLGFGCMRFPIVEEKTSLIDKPKAEEMLLKAIDCGVNYFDTAYPYHGGESESFLGEFHKKYALRDKIYLATKLPSWKIEKYEDFEKYFSEQLEKLQTEQIDFYLVHALNLPYWKNLIKLGLLDFLTNLKKQKRVSFIGFSFHDKISLFRTIIKAYDWDFCQIQYNYVDTDYQAGENGIKLATEKGLGIIVMEPLRGGKLANNIPSDVKELFFKTNSERTPAEWAFRFLLANPSVHLILSGMSLLEQVTQNVACFSNLSSTQLSVDEQKLYTTARSIYKSRMKILCSACNYCLPCPNSINIPAIFELYNDAFMFDDLDASKRMYKAFLKVPATACTFCGVCEKKCPHKINIRLELKNVVKVFGE
jgi:hypothetical protein